MHFPSAAPPSFSVPGGQAPHTATPLLFVHVTCASHPPFLMKQGLKLHPLGPMPLPVEPGGHLPHLKPSAPAGGLRSLQNTPG